MAMGPWDPTKFYDQKECNENNIRHIYGNLNSYHEYTLENYSHLLKFYSNGEVGFDDHIVKRDEYCIAKNSSGKFFRVLPEAIGECDGKYRSLECTMTRIVFPTLYLISLVFLAALTIHLFINQRDKLFGCMRISSIIMLSFFYFMTVIIKFRGKYLAIKLLR